MELPMSRITNEFELAAVAYPNGRIAVLLSRYPRVSGEELDELFAFAKAASTVELHRLRSIAMVKRKLDRLAGDHPERLARRKGDLAWTGAAVTTILLISWFLWDNPSHPLADPPAFGVSSTEIAPLHP